MNRRDHAGHEETHPVQSHTRRSALFAGALSASLLAVTSVGVAAQDASAEPMADTAWVRVLHASPDAPAVDVYANGAEVLSDVPFAVISEYLEVPAATPIQLQVFAASPEPATEGAVIDATLTFEAGTMTTVAATDVLANITPQVIADAPAPVVDMAQVRVVHLSADAPAVDVAPDGAEPIVEGLAYPDATDYLTVAPGAYDLEVRPAGTMDVALQLDPVTLEAGTSVSVFAIGSLAGGTLQVLAAVDAVYQVAEETAKVRVLHGSPDAPAVDVYADGAKVLSDVPFGIVSDYLEVPAGEHQIQVFAAGSDPAEGGAVIDATLAFEAGTMTTVAATDVLANITPQVIADAPAPVADQAQIRVVHLSADAPAVAIAADSDAKNPLIKKLAYPKASKYLTVPAGEYDLQVQVAGKPKQVALDLDPLTVEAGTSYSVFAVGSLEGDTLMVVVAEDASAA
jgi:hypothetical protein